MGKLHSKQGECIMVDLGSKNNSETSSELSVAVQNNDLIDSIPLRVVLPPCKTVSDTGKILVLDQDCDKALDKHNMKTKLNNIEEIECGVSVAGSEKQEWSFTLYDFDGRGKITKEDLAQLLKSLYAAVGSTISLPKSGTKTLKLKLTVSPDNAKANNNINLSPQHQGHPGKENSKIAKDAMKQNNLSPVIGAQASKKTTPDIASKDCKNHHEEVKNTNLLQECSASKLPSKPHLSHKEKRHLVELVQQNMERHHQQQAQMRPKHKSTHHHHHHKLRHKHQGSPQVNTSAATEQPASQESQERRNYYLDLAGIENHNVTCLQNPTVENLQLNSPAEASPSKKRYHRSHERHKNRQRSQSAKEAPRNVAQPTDNVLNNFVIPPYRNLESMVETVAEQSVNQSPNMELPNVQNMNSILTPQQIDEVLLQTPPPPPRMRPVSLPPHLPDVVSPHHHRRHRNRERNRRLAMQQVAEWINREHPTWGGLQVLEEITIDGPPEEAAVQVDSPPQHIVIERHEHHHIHEHHHHHHYHYYQET